MLENLKTFPSVYAVADEYHIMAMTDCETLMWVEIGNESFFDESNGIIRSAKPIHTMIVPMEMLNAEKKYTICYRKVIERKPYFSETEDIIKLTFKFKPIENEKINIYHIADAHNRVNEPVSAGEYFGDDLDLLILNGDIPNHSGDIKYFDAIHEIAGKITKGNIPVIFSRGNHDTRGIYAESIADYTPTDKGNSYFTFRLGDLLGMVLDCGEDKPDDHPEYGNTVCCHNFRRRQTKFIEKVIKNANNEYMEKGVNKRIIVVHKPFTYTQNPPFDIEQELYSYWTKLLNDYINPNFILSGHIHTTKIWHKGGEYDSTGQPCPVIVGAEPLENGFNGCAITYDNDKVNVKFTNHNKEVFYEEEFNI